MVNIISLNRNCCPLRLNIPAEPTADRGLESWIAEQPEQTRGAQNFRYLASPTSAHTLCQSFPYLGHRVCRILSRWFVCAS